MYPDRSASQLLAAFVILLFLPLCIATDHIIGANHGWQVPADAGVSANLNYTVWTAAQTFYLGDEISFHYQAGQHSVYQVNYSVYTNCTFSMYYGNDWIFNWTSKNGRTVIPLNQSKVYYFACGMSNHCQEGMKVAVNVTKNTTSSSTSNQGKTSSKKSSSAASMRPALFSTLVLALALLFISVSLLFPSI